MVTEIHNLDGWTEYTTERGTIRMREHTEADLELALWIKFCHNL